MQAALIQPLVLPLLLQQQTVQIQLQSAQLQQPRHLARRQRLRQLAPCIYLPPSPASAPSTASPFPIQRLEQALLGLGFFQHGQLIQRLQPQIIETGEW